MGKDLRTFLQEANEAGPEFFVRIKKPISPELEISVLQEKLAAQGRFPVIHCPQVKGHELPLVTNLFGSYELLGLALGLKPHQMTRSQIFHEYRRRIGITIPIQEAPAAQAPVKEVILKGNAVDLGQLPITLQAEKNSGKYISAGQLICVDPVSGIPNVAVCRHELRGKDQLGAKLATPTHSAYIAQRYAELGKPMEVVIFIGHHPAVFLASTFHGNIEVNELELMGGLLGEPLQLTRAETVDLPVPALAEIAIEGVINPGKMITDGPYSELMGYYGEVQPCYLMQVTAITRRRDAIYHNLEPAHREHTQASVLGNQVAIYDAVKSVVPSVQDIYLPPSGRNWVTSYISIKKRLSGEGVRAGLAAINALHAVKLAVVVDEDIDAYNEEEVLWAVATRVRPDRDVTIIPRTVGIPLDPTTHDETGTERGVVTSKMVIDATVPLGQPFATRVRPPSQLWQTLKPEDYLE